MRIYAIMFCPTLYQPKDFFLISVSVFVMVLVSKTMNMSLSLDIWRNLLLCNVLSYSISSRLSFSNICCFLKFFIFLTLT